MIPLPIQLRKFLRGSARLIWSYLTVNWRLFLFGFLVGSVLIYLSPDISSKLSTKKIPAIGLVGNYTISTLPVSLQHQLSFGLTSLLPDGQATPAAASTWAVEDDGKTIAFELKDDLFWQDGTKFDASQVSYNLKGVEVRRLSLHKIQFRFNDAFSPLVALVSQPLFKTGLTGLGSEHVEAIKFNGRFIGGLTIKNKKDGSAKTYKFYPNEATAVTALKLGSVDQVRSLHQSFGLETNSNYDIQGSTNPSTLALIFLNLHKDKFSEKSFRQALAYALPDTFDQGEEAPSSLPKNNWAQSGAAKRYSQNLPLARELIGKLASSEAKPRLVLSSPEALSPVAKRIAQAWQQVGIDTSTKTAATPDLSFDAHLTLLDLPVDPDQYALWHSTQNGNISGYKSFKVDHLLEDGRKTFKISDRKEIYAALEKALTEDVPAIFLYYPKIYTISRK